MGISMGILKVMLRILLVAIGDGELFRTGRFRSEKVLLMGVKKAEKLSNNHEPPITEEAFRRED